MAVFPEIHFAPLQGYTDRIYRNAFARHFGGIEVYYTPFIRVESDGTFRQKDLRDIDPALEQVPGLIPQILPGNAAEFRLLAALLQAKGYRQADINLGCSFPLIAGRKKGAGMLAFPDLVKETLAPLEEFPELRFSVKMRLGWENVSEGIKVVDILNSLRLDHVCIHARLGKQQYKGVPDWNAFGDFYRACRWPLFANGDLNSPEEIKRILVDFPLLRGVLIGRGLLSSPLLIKEFKENRTFLPIQRMECLSGFHQTLFSAYREQLKDDNQLLKKMKTLWDYLLPEAERKGLKRIRKAGNLQEYEWSVWQLLHAGS